MKNVLLLLALLLFGCADPHAGVFPPNKDQTLLMIREMHVSAWGTQAP